MAGFAYPQSDFDRPRELLRLLGSFWGDVYADDRLTADHVAVAGQIANQTNRQLLELVNSVSRKDIPIYHSEDWTPLVVRESALQRSVTPLRFGDDAVYGNAVYGQDVSQAFYRIAKPPELVTAAYLFDRIIAPTRTLCVGVDVLFSKTEIILVSNPFFDAAFPKRDVLNEVGEIIDREIILWCYEGREDWGTLYEQFGYVLDVALPTSESYKAFLNAIFDSLALGTSAALQRKAIAAAFGVPVVHNPVEKVVEIRTDVGSTAVITDANAYVFPPGAVPRVQEGDIVRSGDYLADTLQLFEFTDGSVPAADDIASLTLETGLLAYGYWHGLTFENKLVDVVVEADVQGYTRVSWPLGGFSLDVEKFWDDVHAAGVAAGQTLAMLLDLRPEPVGQPFAACLPTRINPFAFLVQNFLRGNAVVVKVRSPRAPHGLPFVPVDTLRRTQPPHTVMIFVFELVQQDAPIIMESAGTEMAPGYTEQFSSFPCIVFAEELNAESLLTDSLLSNPALNRCN